MKVSTRLALAFGLVIVLMFGLGAVSVSSLMTLNRQVDTLANSSTPQILAAGRWEVAVLQTARHMRNVFILPDAAAVKEELKAIHAGKAERKEIMEQLGKTVANDRQKQLLENIVEARRKYIPYEDQFLKLAEAGMQDEAKKVMLEHARPLQLAYIDQIDKFVDQLEAEARDAAKEAAHTYRSSLGVIVGVAVLALLVAIVLGAVITRSLRRQLGGEPGDAAAIANRIAGGDLTVQVEVGRNDRGSLMYAMGRMVQNLRELVAQVSEGARVVSDTSGQIAQGNVDLSQRTEEQASTLEETASQMEELTSTVTQNADNARQASQLAVGASEVARKGGEVVGEVVSTMTGISEASRKIADIIGVIDGIAFQTNILALNAAVEAARAGEQGRGFAVVATEVRNLAQRSAAAAKEIKTLIGDSAGKVEAGTRLVDAAGRTMEEIVTSVKRVSDLVSEIAAASQEQSAGIEQVNTAVTQMDQVVQQNASLVEEATAATESMKAQAASLLQSLSRFDLGAAAAAYVPVQAARSHEHAATPAPIRFRPVAVKGPSPEIALPRPANGHAPNGNGAWREF
ncbi:methyl-accepting chemotaxis protein [Ramlibacter sp.]|uniref:methyl-accepting chemotaxis protein n=1 Tax=Ramlibacter sp. TaxID=1917967 RepID=UPI002ED3BE28